MDNIARRNQSMIDQHLGSIRHQSGSVLDTFLKTINDQMSSSKALNQGYRDQFDQGNVESRANINKYQSQIATIPGYDPVAQLTSGPEAVNGWSNLGRIGVQRGTININKTPTMTGLNAAQQSSRERQKVGIQGLRRGS